MNIEVSDISFSARDRRDGKSDSAFRTIGEVVDELDVPQHVLRFWETKFSKIRPLKRAGGRRYYRPEDVALLRRIRDLLYNDGFTIKGVQKLLRENGVKGVANNATQIALDLAGDIDEAVTPESSCDAHSVPDVKALPQADMEHLLAEMIRMRAELSAALAYTSVRAGPERPSCEHHAD